MRSDVKVGLAIGLVFLTALIIYMATRSGPSPDQQIADLPDDVEDVEQPRRGIDDFLEDLSDPQPVRDPQPQVDPPVDEDPVPRPQIDPMEPAVEDDDPEEEPALQPDPVQEEPDTAPAVDARTWTVRRGDNLWRISEEVYGDGRHHQLIFEANRDKLRSPDALAEGMELTIPPRPDEPQLDVNVLRYTVERGDTLWSLAQQHYQDGNQWRRIAEANDMGEGDRLYEGQVIIIPLD